MSGLQRYCTYCREWVPQAHAEIVASTETGSGPGLPTWACRPCAARHGGQFIGRRDVAPIPPGDAA